MVKLYESDAIVQLIPTIQGEINVGKPAILLRLRGCNCHCSWCDSKNTWSNDSDIQLTEKDIEAILKLSAEFPNIKRLLITGGEPLLYQNQELFLDILNLNNFPFLEIETNGSLLTSKTTFIDEIVGNYLTINISPKVNPTFYQNQDHYNNFVNGEFKKTIENISNSYKWSVLLNLKFVYENNIESDFNITKINQFIEINDVISNVGLNSIYLMSNTPADILSNLRNNETSIETYLKLNENDIDTIKQCLKYGYSFSPRAHLSLFKDKNEMSNVL